jgi:hypothetical protein
MTKALTVLGDVAEIAKGLTEAQRRAFRDLTPTNPVLVGRPRTLRVLAKFGVCWPPKHWEINTTTVLARPPAFAVRQHLSSLSKEEKDG